MREGIGERQREGQRVLKAEIAESTKRERENVGEIESVMEVERGERTGTPARDGGVHTIKQPKNTNQQQRRQEADIGSGMGNTREASTLSQPATVVSPNTRHIANG